jgi:hypothetical protein
MIFQALLIFPFMWVLSGVPWPFGRWERSHLTLPERFVFRTAWGLGVLAYVLFALGLLGAFHRAAFIVALAVFFLLSLPGQRTFLKDLAARRAEARANGASGWLVSWEDKALLGAILVFALLMLIGCASPPTGMDWDGLSYHLADPKLFLRAGRIYPLPWEHHSNFTFTLEMLFSLGLAFDSPVFAKSFHFATGLLTAAAMTLAVLRLYGSLALADESDSTAEKPRARWVLLPAALFLGAPLVFWEGTVAYIDLAATMYAFLGALAFTLVMIEKEDTPGRQEWFLLSGLMMGFATGTKATNVILLILLACWGFWVILRSGYLGAFFNSLVLRLLLPALLIASPWFIKSTILTGNPIYPFFYNIFGGKNWNAQLALTYDLEQFGFGMGRTLPALLKLPWNLTLHPAWDENGHETFSKGIGMFASLGPFALGLMPLLCLSRPLPRWTKAWLLVTLGFTLIWFMLTQQVRYFLPLYPMLCLLSAFALEKADLNRTGRLAAGLFIGFGLLLSAAKAALYLHTSNMLPVALGQVTPEEFLYRSSELYPACRFVNTELPPSTKVLMIEETRGYYLDRDYMWGNPGHHTLIPWDSFKTPQQLTQWLESHGFTHVLINSRFMRRNWGSSPWERLILEAIKERVWRPVFTGNWVEVLALSSPQGK